MKSNDEAAMLAYGLIIGAFLGWAAAMLVIYCVAPV